MPANVDPPDPPREREAPLPVELSGDDQLYLNLRGLAARSLERRSDAPTLQPTALVHEVWLRLASADQSSWKSREHFLASAALTMRRVLSNHARDRRAAKRGGAAVRVDLDEALVPVAATGVDLVALDDALSELAAQSARAANVVCLRFFSGLSPNEIAEHLGVSERTVERDWRLARAWLEDKLGTEP